MVEYGMSDRAEAEAQKNRAGGADEVHDEVHDNVYDVIGIGFGPANMALAIAMEEAPAEKQVRRLFLESKPSAAWHPGMLIEGSLLQITALKDLITVENPRSRFTFLNYLKEKGRLYDFLNLRDLFPSRIEYNDYIVWAAGELAERVRYGRRVVEVAPVTADGNVTDGHPELLRVSAQGGESGKVEHFLCRHLVLAAGSEVTTPPGIELEDGDTGFGGRLLHSVNFRHRIAKFDDREAPYRFIVIGGGQSAGELFEYLMDRYPNADVTATTRNFGYKPVDESDFTNRIFFPEWTDYFYDLPNEKRRKFFDNLKDVNYAVIDHPLIRRIYRKLYDQKVSGRERARLLPFLELRGIREGENGLRVEFQDLMRESPVVESLGSIFERDDRGGYQVQRDYTVAAKDGFQPKVYLQGYCEDTHGIGETVLSLLPVRAREILDSISASRNS